jgi:hypothetical protein
MNHLLEGAGSSTNTVAEDHQKTRSLDILNREGDLMMGDSLEGWNTKPDSQQHKKARSEIDKCNLQALRDHMTRHLRSQGLPRAQDSMIAGPSNPENPAEITSSGRISNDGASQLPFDPQHLEFSPDTSHALFGRGSRNPKPSAFRVSDTSREILILGKELLEHMNNPSKSPDLRALDDRDNDQIYKLISNTIKIHDKALKESDGGTGKAGSAARKNARTMLENIADCLKNWQNYVKHEGPRPKEVDEVHEKVDKGSITKETYLNALDIPHDLPSRLAKGPVPHVTENGTVIEPATIYFPTSVERVRRFEARLRELIQQQGWGSDYHRLFKTEEYPESNCYGFAHTNCEGGHISAQDTERILREHYGNEPIMVGRITGKGTGSFEKAKSKKDPVPGDLCVFRNRKGELNHIAVYTFTTTDGQLHCADKPGIGNIYGHPLFSVQLKPNGDEREIYPDYGPNIEIYHTNRPGGRLLDKRPPVG